MSAIAKPPIPCACVATVNLKNLILVNPNYRHYEPHQRRHVVAIDAEASMDLDVGIYPQVRILRKDSSI